MKSRLQLSQSQDHTELQDAMADFQQEFTNLKTEVETEDNPLDQIQNQDMKESLEDLQNNTYWHMFLFMSVENPSAEDWEHMWQFLDQNPSLYHHIRELHLDSSIITTLPSEFVTHFPNITLLNMENSNISQLPDNVDKWTNLNTINLHMSDNTTLPDNLTSIPNLTDLDISRSNITVLPDKINDLTQLKTLNISNTPIEKFPMSIADLSNLRSLDAHSTSISAVPLQFSSLLLKDLDLSYCAFEASPSAIFSMSTLKTLDLSNNHIKQLDVKGVGFEQMTALESLDLSGNPLGDNDNFTEFLQWIYTIPHLTSLNLRNCWIQDLPSGISELPLVELNLSNNKLIGLPSDFVDLTTLETLNLRGNGHNQFDDIHILGDDDDIPPTLTLPDDLSGLVALRDLDLGDNHYQSIPLGLGTVPNLHTLNLNRNPIGQADHRAGPDYIVYPDDISKLTHNGEGIYTRQAGWAQQQN